jgi:hypothetical protein
MATLSEDEARDIVEGMLPKISNAIKERGETKVYITDMEKSFVPISREGNTPDVYCKIAGAASEHGISTDLVAVKDRMAMMFQNAGPGYRAPSTEICKKRWEYVKKRSTAKPKRSRIKMELNPEDYWD